MAIKQKEFLKRTDMEQKLIINPGLEDFRKVIESGSYYIDKTGYLEELLTGSGGLSNSIFLRPRRFGKTLNMSMVYEFCRLNYQNPGEKSYQEKLFLDNGRNLAIAEDEFKDFRDKFMGEFPVISFSFKTIEGPDFITALSRLLGKIGNLYEKFLFLKDSKKIPEGRKEVFLTYYDFCVKNRPKSDLDYAIQIAGSFVHTLASMLFTEFNRNIIILLRLVSNKLRQICDQLSAQFFYFLEKGKGERKLLFI